jgi:hypothetical protein
MKEEKTECIPARYSKGKMKDQIVASRVHGARIARDELIKREPPPFPRAVCRHTCKNDSTSPNGFVCVSHTVWGTPPSSVLYLLCYLFAVVAFSYLYTHK